MVDGRKVPEGYKVTEAGVIPDDWEVKKLAEICTLSNQKYNPKKNTDNFPCIELEHISPEIGRLLGTTNSLDQLSMKNYFFKGDTLLGKLRPYLKKYLYAYFDGVCSTEIWVLRPQNYTDDRYLYYMIQSEKVIDACNKSSGTKMPRAEWKVVQDTIIQLPPLKEQKSIAEALSETDNLIQSLENLINKKKKIKQGAMQQLLTGKKRLPGFDGEWEIKKLGEMSRMQSGGTPRTEVKQFYNGKIPWASINDMTASRKYLRYTEKKITQEGLNNSSAVLFPEDTILYAMYASIGECVITKKEVSSSQAILGIQCYDQILCVEYLYYYLSFIKYFMRTQGQTGTQSNLNKNMVQNINIMLPSIEEQKAIAQVLSDMDLEIEALEEKLEKYKTIKQGMMQELLTGRIRLI